MPRKASDTETVQQSIRLPTQAWEMIDQLVELGIHGNSRAEVARGLILSRLEQLLVGGIIRR